jgi:hypothetical protein
VAKKVVGSSSTVEEPKVIPSFAAVVSEGVAARDAELEKLAGGAAPDAPLPAAEEPKTPPLSAESAPAYDWDKEWTKLPDDLRNGFVDRFNTQYANALRDQYGDLVPLIEEVQKNPNLRATLAAAATDPELREYLADPKSRDEIKQLTRKELREFLFGQGENPNAVQLFDKYNRQIESDTTPKDANSERLDALERKYQGEVDSREHQGYISSRQREVQALLAEFPELKSNQKQFQHVLEWGEDRFEQAAARAGIDTNLQRNPYWPAQALRKGVKPPQYRDGQAYYAEVLARPKTPTAPATSEAKPPANPQAPRSVSEGRKRGLELLKKSGGFNSMVKRGNR